MIRFLSAAVSLLTAITLSLTSAHAGVENTWDYSVQVSSAVQASPAKITLSWPQDTNGTPSSYTIYRKAPTDSSWGSGTTISGSSTSYTDTNVNAGVAYEYRLVKAASGYTGYGYIETGVNVPAIESRGKVILLVDNSMSGPLASELTRLQQDLVGDGWTVLRHDVSRTDSVNNVKALIKNDYNADPANVKSVFLFGHIPVPYSGQLNPDGHPDHVGAWPADAFYGDIDGNWTDNSVNYTQTINTDRTDAARISNVPGDGKFDQSDLPSAIELQVGRVDLANMPGRLVWGGPATFATETELLRKYLNKDHAFRTRATNPPRRALMGDYFGTRGGEAFAASGFRAFAPLVGTNNVRNLNLELNDQRGVWIPQCAAADYLFAYACGAGSYVGMSGIGNIGLYNEGDTTDIVAQNTRAVFNLLFGSWLGDWDHEDDLLRSPLANDYGLVSVWSGRPHWFMHTLGQGETFGSVAKLTQNNVNTYETQINTAAHRIHIALMGDPTLRLHPVVPVGTINGAANGGSVSLNWGASSDTAIVGYHVYRANSASDTFSRLTSSPITGTSYTDSSAPSGAVYMVRAIKLENTTSGSYYNPSQGVFWSASTGSSGGSTTTTPAADTTAPTVSLSAPASGSTISASVTVSANANDAVGVTGVQFKLDGANLGSEVTSAPFSTALNTTALTNGTHTLGAVARDAAGNMASATTLSVTVANVVASSGGTSSGSTSGSTSTSTASTAASNNSGTTVGPISTTNTTLDLSGGTMLWIDDALPAGAGGLGTTGGDTWNWVTSPTIAGSKAHKSDAASGQHGHWFGWSNAPLIVNAGEILFTYVYIDPANPPAEIMLSWQDASSWEHRAYWGADKISGGSGTGHYYAGALPEAGKWVRLEVPAKAVGLDTSIVTAMGFSLFNGAATFDAAGKTIPSAPLLNVSTADSSTTTTTTSGTTTPSGQESVWFDDALPANAGGAGGSGDTWNWVTSPTFSGTKAHKSDLATGKHEHWFGWSDSNLSVGSGESLYAYVYLDPANAPTQLMISWSTNGSWEHRAYWGANQFKMGSGAAYYRAGNLPPTGQWVRLEVPASAVGLENTTVVGAGFALNNGTAVWDKTGKFSGASASANGYTTTGSTSGGSTGGTTSGGTTTTSTSGGSTSGGSTSGGSTSSTTTTTTPSTTTSGGTSSGGTTSGTTTTTTPSTTTSTTAANETAFIDDSLPAGAGGLGTSGGDTWNWVTSPVIAGTKAHRSDLASGTHQHWYGWANTNLTLGSGDALYTYVYLDPANTPAEIMVTWQAGGSWEHRAYWGANKIDVGSGTGRYYAGALPPAGQWVRLEVPAASVGLTGATISSMGFALYDGAATWDASGKFTGTASTAGWTSAGTASSGTTTPTNTGGSTSTSTTPTVTVTATDQYAVVGTLLDVAQLTFTRTGSTANALTVNFNLGGNAVKWTDYRRPVEGDMPVSITIPAGASSATMSIWAAANSTNANPETATFTIASTSDSSVTIGTEKTATLTFLPTGSTAPSSGSTSGGTSSGTSTSTTSTTSTSSGGTSSGGTSSGTSTSGTTTTSTGGTSSGTTVTTVSGENALARIPQVGDYELRVLTPTLLELRRIISKPTGDFTDWNFVDTNGNFSAPATSKFTVTANGQNVGVSSVGFRRIAAYGPLRVRDLRVEANLYLKLSSALSDGQAIEVKNSDGSLWSSSMQFAAKVDTLRFSPAIHVNQEGYAPSLTKKAMVGYYLGNMGEMTFDASKGFTLVNASTGVTVYTGTLNKRNETGYQISPAPYQFVYEADFTSFKTPGEYQLVVPGMGASLPFLINDGVTMAVARAYELGIYHQRCGGTNDLPYTRFTHAACHMLPAEVPTSDAQYDGTWKVIASYSGGTARQTAPQLTSPATQLYPFVNQGPIDTKGGHHDAGDYSKYTIDVALLAHQLMFTAENIKGASNLDNLGIPESGDGISDIMQEGKWEADYLAKLQDADGGFYFIVYPKKREYEWDGSLQDGGDQQVVWPKNTSATAAAVGVLAEFASSPLFKKSYPNEAAAYLAKAKLGWQFLTNAIAKYGKDGAYQRITFYGDEWMHDDELAWAAAAMYAATGDTQYQTKLKEWFPNPADQNTFHWSWERLYQGWGCAIRDYAFAVRSGRLSAGQVDAAYLAACEGQITAAAEDALRWTNGSAYGTSFPDNTKHGMQTGWFFSLETAAPMAMAYQINPKQEYLDAIVTNMNYELGANPVNVSFVAGLGVKRPTQMVSQYRDNNRHVLPPIGEPMSNVHSAFGYLPVYGNDLSGVSFPKDGSDGSSYWFQDRFSDIWNVTTEFVTLDQGRALVSAAFLAVQTPAQTTAWKPANSAVQIVAGTGKVGTPMTLSLNLGGLDISNTRITWEARDQNPDFGSTFTLTPKNTGANWVEVEIAYPDGRRVFVNGSFNVQ